MAAGLQPTKAELDAALGAILRDYRVVTRRAVDFKEWLDGVQDADLTAMGYAAGDIANIRSAFVDAKKINDIFEGTATQATTNDFRAFMKRLWGTGGASGPTS
jgi:hypothetical protein